MTIAGLHVAGTIRVPGDKSISHRSLIFAALAPGKSKVRNILNSADTRATARVLNLLGARVPELAAGVVVQGVHPDALHTPGEALDCANSGTTTRLIMGVLAGLEGAERPIRRR